MARRWLVLTALMVGALALPAAELVAQYPMAWVLPRSAAVVSEQGAFEELLANREALELSDRQVAGIREIGRELARKNEPVMAQLRDAEVWGVETEEEEAALREVQERYREHGREADAEVRELLTAEQRERVDELFGDRSLAYGLRELDDDEEPEAEALATTLTIENHFHTDVTIYLHRGAMRQRVARVSGLRTETVNLPQSLVFGMVTLHFEVRALAYRQPFWSDQVVVQAGDEVRLRIPPSMR